MSRLPALLFILFICFLVFLGFTHIVLGKLGWDELEHLHVAWLINEGKAPFADFFEHHLPTFWYLLAAFAGGLGVGDARLLLLGRMLMGATYLVSGFLCYRSTSRMRPEHRALITSLFLLLSACGSLFSLRPEAVAVPLFLLALCCLERDEDEAAPPITSVLLVSFLSLGAAMLTPRAWPIFLPLCLGAAWKLRRVPRRLLLWSAVSLVCGLLSFWLLRTMSGGFRPLVEWVFAFSRELQPPSYLFKLHRYPRMLFAVFGLVIGAGLRRFRAGQYSTSSVESLSLAPACVLSAATMLVLSPVELWCGLYGDESFFYLCSVVALILGIAAGYLLPPRSSTSVLPAALGGSVLLGFPALLSETRPFLQSLSLLGLASATFVILAFDWPCYFWSATTNLRRFISALPVLLLFQLALEQFSLTLSEAGDSLPSARSGIADWRASVRALSQVDDAELWRALELRNELLPALQAREVACSRFKGRRVLVESTGNPLCLDDASYFWFGIVYFRAQTPVPGELPVRSIIESDLQRSSAFYFSAGFLDELRKFPPSGELRESAPPFEPQAFGYRRVDFGWLRTAISSESVQAPQ